MVTIRWCLSQRHGIELIKPNENMGDSYLDMAKESIKILDKVLDSNIWSATTSYYIYYYSLYALMLRIGVKCEIHTCSIKFLEQFLSKHYNEKEIDIFKKAFLVRQDLQYYANRIVNKESLELVIKHCKLFFIKTKEIINNITEKEIKQIRVGLK